MTRRDAKMVAEELYKLMEATALAKDTLLTKEEAAAKYKVPVSHFEHYGKNYSPIRIGRSYKYSDKKIAEKLLNK